MMLLTLLLVGATSTITPSLTPQPLHKPLSAPQFAPPAPGQIPPIDGSKLQHVYPLVPDPAITIGRINPEATSEAVCAGKMHQPKVPYKLKQDVAHAYGYTGSFNKVQFDRLIPPELGGVNDFVNIWPQAYDQKFQTYDEAGKPVTLNLGAHQKDLVEADLIHRVCVTKDLSLTEAQAVLRADWVRHYLEMRKTGRSRAALKYKRNARA